MAAAPTEENMSPKFLKVVEKAKQDPQLRFNSLAHLLDEEMLAGSYERIRKDAAVGIDGMTKEQYGLNLEMNIRALHERLKAGQYRHQPIRRVHIYKEPGKTRPIGISTLEDKIVQGALTTVLGALYEPVFHEFSYGSRPGRGAHGALRALNKMTRPGAGEVKWILEADIKGYFDNIVRSQLMEMLQKRVADGSFLRLVGKCLHVGVLDGEEYTEPEIGTAQGSVISSVLGNIYLHHVLDTWFVEEVKPRLRGAAQLVRYADDFIIGFEHAEDAEKVRRVLDLRMARFGLTLHPDKTRVLPFSRPAPQQEGGKGPATFDFLGFTAMWVRSRKGRWTPGLKTRKARLNRAIQNAADWCRGHRHLPVKEQHAGLVRRINGHFNYFGVNGNLRSLGKLVHHAKRAWYKWLNRRSQRSRLNWKRFTSLLEDYPLPRPRVCVRIWGA